MKLNKKYKLYMIHHSHTDIGYTHRPEETILQQVKYIYDVISYLDQIEQGKSEWKGFKWVCETFVIVEKFIESANEEDLEKFVKYIQMGKIGFSFAFANMSELVSPEIMERMIKRAGDFKLKNNLPSNCGMQADVNGFSLGYAKALSEHGVENYYACVHTHHGMYPIYKKHAAFWWELPNGKKLLVWNGEHYMFGNGFGFAPGAVSLYGFNDDADFEKYNKEDSNLWMELSEVRFEKYINQLIEDGYDKDYISLCIHGKFTDNSMPNPEIATRINEWNKKNGSQLEVELVTLDQFFEVLRKDEDDFPTYSGEWPDWWSDGIGSAPRELKIFKNTQDRYSKLLETLKYKNLKYNLELCNKIDHGLVMYSEHTYGSWDSISNPYHAFTQEQWAAKQWYLFESLRNVDLLEFEMKNSLKDASSTFLITKKWKIINANDTSITKIVRLPYGGCDTLSFKGGFKITDEHGKEYVYNLVGGIPEIEVTLTKKSELKIFVDIDSNPNANIVKRPQFARTQLGGTDNVDDLNLCSQVQECMSKYTLTSSSFSNDFVEIKWDENGINYWFNKKLDVNIIDYNHRSNPFNPVYEVTNETPRNQIGRNRKGIDVERDIGRIVKVKKGIENENYVSFFHYFEIKGCSGYVVEYKCALNFDNIDISIRIDKNLEKNPENLFISLAFNYGDVWFGKGKELIRPWKDQVEGTLTDFYSVFEGLIFNKGNENLLITTPDTQLIQVGSLEFKDRILMGDESLKNENQELYIWSMNNIWETNFVCSLAGFYEFNYSITTTKGTKKDSLLLADALNKGVTIIGEKE